MDNGHVVAWSESMYYKVGLATRSWLGSLTSGEGLMVHFEGPGVVYVQSHNPNNAMQTRMRGARGGGGSRGSPVFVIFFFFCACCFLFFFLAVVSAAASGDVQVSTNVNSNHRLAAAHH